MAIVRKQHAFTGRAIYTFIPEGRLPPMSEEELRELIYGFSAPPLHSANPVPPDQDPSDNDGKSKDR